ncbi:MAG TPA: DUF2244 domain-containing protein [Rhodanobacter sp.]|nr:DUF2244 domain-containing protein [Rhodanobacter sp.]
MIVLRPAVADPSGVTIWLLPNRTLSRRGMHRLIVALVVLALATSVWGGWQGNVFAPLFAAFESGAMAIALAVAWRAGDRSERIMLGAAALEVRSSPGSRQVCFQPYWVRARLEDGDNGHRRLLLASHGRELEIGTFLAEPERIALWRKLKVLLGGNHDQPRGWFN